MHGWQNNPGPHVSIDKIYHRYCG